jgi:hypothetical protein
MKRRKIIQTLSTLPLIGPLSIAGARGEHVSWKKKRDIIAELGIRSFINAAGTLTYMSGALCTRRSWRQSKIRPGISV